MGDTIMNIIWGSLVGWTFFVPDGYGPYILLGFSGGDFLILLYCWFTDGYLKEAGDIKAFSLPP